MPGRRFAGLARIVITGTEAEVHAPSWARDLIRSTPGRRWSAEDRCWTIPTVDVPILAGQLRGEGYIVRIIEPGKPQPPLVLPGRKGTARR